MKTLFKKNQLMISALAIMLAIAGYLQFAGRNLEEEYLEAGEMLENPENDVYILSDDIARPRGNCPWISSSMSKSRKFQQDILR